MQEQEPVATTALLPVIREHIAIKPGYCGGKPHVAGHRIKVQDVVVWHERMGMSPDEIVGQHPGLTMADVFAALAYYWDHREEIEADIREGQEFADKLRNGAPSIFEKAQQRNAPDNSLSPG